MAQLNMKKVWKTVKNIRRKFVSENIDPKCLDHGDPTFLFSNYMKDNNDILAKKLKLNTTTTPNDNVTYETLKTAGEMFIYLNYCPDRLWPLMEHILNNEKPKDIILALISIKKYPKVSTKESSEKIMRKVLERMNLLQYENFQIITKGKCYVNGSFDSCKSKIDLNETNIKQLGLS